MPARCGVSYNLTQCQCGMHGFRRSWKIHARHMRDVPDTSPGLALASSTFSPYRMKRQSPHSTPCT